MSNHEYICTSTIQSHLKVLLLLMTIKINYNSPTPNGTRFLNASWEVLLMYFKTPSLVLLSAEVNGRGLVGNADSQQNVVPPWEALVRMSQLGISALAGTRGAEGNTVGVARFGKVRVHGKYSRLACTIVPIRNRVTDKAYSSFSWKHLLFLDSMHTFEDYPMSTMNRKI